MYSAIAVLACGPLVLVAGQKNYWETKPYTEWSEKEVDRLLKDSPWTRSVLLSTGPDRSMASGGGGRGGDAEVSQGGGSLRGATPRLVINWVARPIREAMARRLLLAEPEASRERIEKLLHPNDQFLALLVTGWTLGRAPDRNAALEKFRQETLLQKKDRTQMPLADMVPPQRREDPLYLRFPRQVDGKPALRLEDQEVTLVLRVGEETYRFKFKLADMVIQGKLEI
jgi:hypothetical protein